MNRIASTVITWDVAELKRQVAAIEKLEDGPSKKHYEAIKAHMALSREDREQQRLASRTPPQFVFASTLLI